MGGPDEYGGGIKVCWEGAAEPILLLELKGWFPGYREMESLGILYTYIIWVCVCVSNNNNDNNIIIRQTTTKNKKQLKLVVIP